MLEFSSSTKFGSIIWEYNSALFNEYNNKDDCLANHSDASELLLLEEERNSITLKIETKPYSTPLWRNRAKCHLRLHQPGLAASDAWKCLRLLKTRMSKAESEKIYRSSDAMMILCQALFFASSFRECVNTIVEFRAGLGHNSRCLADLQDLQLFAQRGLDAELVHGAEDGHTREEMEEATASGELRVSAYSWAQPNHLTRTPQTRRRMRDVINRLSAGKCTIHTSDVGHNAIRDCYGIFAKANISRGSVLFVEKENLVAVNHQSLHCRACKCRVGIPGFCNSKSCLANQGIQDLSRVSRIIQEELLPKLKILHTQDATAFETLRCRVLLGIARRFKSNGTHPLDSSPINQLTGFTSHHTHVHHFSLARDIEWPLEVLQMLGIDIFKNLEFDAWVLFTIMQRVDANTWESYEELKNGKCTEETYWKGISPSYSLFNHSCTPNVSWEQVPGTGILVITAIRDLSKGEELYISYLDKTDLRLPAKERGEKLQRWMPNGHACASCNGETMKAEPQAKSGNCKEQSEKEEELQQKRQGDELKGSPHKVQKCKDGWTTIDDQDTDDYLRAVLPLHESTGSDSDYQQSLADEDMDFD